MAEWHPEGYDPSVGYVPSRDIVPILIVTSGDDPDIKAFMGTGFLLKMNVFVTFHHCVAQPLEDGDRYVVAVSWAFVHPRPEILTGPYGFAELEDIEQDPSGLDLATARLPFSSMLLNLAPEGLRLGDNIFTYSYPFTESLCRTQYQDGPSV